MTMQKIFDSAQAVEVNRTKLIAHSMSRNGKLLVASRNWVNPWRFVVTPKPVWVWANERGVIEAVVNADRYNTHTFKLGSEWLTAYQGDMSQDDFDSGTLCISVVNNQLTIRVYGDVADPFTACGKIAAAGDDYAIFRAGDIIQVQTNLYPHAVTADVTKAQGTVDPEGTYYQFVIPLHRGFLGSTLINGLRLNIGKDCEFNCIATKMPTYQYYEYGRVSFNGSFELMEHVE